MPDPGLMGVDTTVPFTDSLVNTGPAQGKYGTYGFYAQALGAASAGLGDILAAGRQATALKTQSYLDQSQIRENDQRLNVQKQQIGVQRQSALLGSAIQYNSLKGLQTAAYSSQDVKVNNGTAAVTGYTQEQLGALNALTLKNNAVLQAWGVTTQSQETTNQQKMQSQGELAQAAQEPWLGFEEAANTATTVAEDTERTRAMFSGVR